MVGDCEKIKTIGLIGKGVGFRWKLAALKLGVYSLFVPSVHSKGVVRRHKGQLFLAKFFLLMRFFDCFNSG